MKPLANEYSGFVVLAQSLFWKHQRFATGSQNYTSSFKESCATVRPSGTGVILHKAVGLFCAFGYLDLPAQIFDAKANRGSLVGGFLHLGPDWFGLALVGELTLRILIHGYTVCMRIPMLRDVGPLVSETPLHWRGAWSYECEYPTLN